MKPIIFFCNSEMDQFSDKTSRSVSLIITCDTNQLTELQNKLQLKSISKKVLKFRVVREPTFFGCSNYY